MSGPLLAGVPFSVLMALLCASLSDQDDDLWRLAALVSVVLIAASAVSAARGRAASRPAR